MIRALLLILLAGSSLASSAAAACAPAFRAGDFVTVAAEEALIVWDAERRREHFIRRADFDTTAEDFGFLVPTPTQPELAEADDSVFGALAGLIAPPVEHTSRWVPSTCCTLGCYALLATSGDAEMVMATRGMDDAVRVLDTVRVAGLDATVLEADDAGALATWLGENGYQTRPALEAWLRPYVEQGYKITAFKLAKGEAETEGIGSQAVRMSFDADEPFYPYREPSDHPEADGRSLRVYFVGAERRRGRVADGRWSARTEFSAPLDLDGTLRGVVPDDALPGEAWLTSFLDRASRRENADLWLVPEEDQNELRPDPIVIESGTTPIPIPVEPVLLGLLIWWIIRRRRAKRAMESAAPP